MVPSVTDRESEASLTHGAPAEPAARPHLIQMLGIRKQFGTVVALDGVDFELRPGEIHTVLGENGAGKTTLMRVLFGMIQPDAGSILVEGQAVHLRSPRDALARRIGMVHQHFMLVPNMTVAENVVIGARSAWAPRFSSAQVEEETRKVAMSFGMELDTSKRVDTLSVDAMQRVEILKLLYRGARILILDEPTGALGPNEIRALFATLIALRDMGNAIVVITHKLSEAMEIADRVTVLRAGQVKATTSRGGFDERYLAQAMIGHQLAAVTGNHEKHGDREVRLVVENLVVRADSRRPAVDGVGFTLHAGEILGFAGVEGNGQLELAQALAGLRKATSGSIMVGGFNISAADPGTVHRQGVSVISEDRLQWDIIPDLTLAENLALGGVASGRYSRWGFLTRQRYKADARRLLAEFDVRPPDPSLKAVALSGGNQQKVVLARELARRPNVLIAAGPTRGLDIGATEFVHEQLLGLRHSGCGIVLISLDLDELLALSDRIMVLYRGRIVYHRAATNVSIDAIAAAMTGATSAEARSREATGG
jgi:ABC-type uncharacterized transport system ATPase subunit